MLVDRHQVIGFSPRAGKALLQKFIERLQVLQSPVLPCPDLAQVLPQLHKPRVLLLLFALLPAQDLIDLAEDEDRPPTIQFRCHGSPSVNPQARQANQDCSLLPCAPDSCRLTAGCSDKAPDGGSSGSRFGESGYRCAQQTEPLRSGRWLSPPGARTLAAVLPRSMLSNIESREHAFARRRPMLLPESR